MDASKALLDALADYLEAKTVLKAVRVNFPLPNEQLDLPCATIFAGSPEFTNLMPYPLLVAEPYVNNKALVKTVVGQYDYKLQLDFWCGSKQERFTVFENFFAALNKDISPMGLSLQLENYHGIWARYDMIGINFDDSEAGSQRAEWRVKVDVLAHCKAILEREETIITAPIETALETVDTSQVTPGTPEGLPECTSEVG